MEIDWKGSMEVEGIRCWDCFNLIPPGDECLGDDGVHRCENCHEEAQSE